VTIASLAARVKLFGRQQLSRGWVSGSDMLLFEANDKNNDWIQRIAQKIPVIFPINFRLISRNSRRFAISCHSM
jgi:hypothetical protein